MRRFMLLALLFTLAGLNAAHAQSTSQKSSADDITFDFQETDIKVVITAIAEAGRLNVSYGALPPRNVTLRTSQALPRTGMRSLLQSLLAANGLRLVEDGMMLRVDIAEAARIAQAPPPPVEAAPTQHGPLLHVYRLKHARATRIASTIQALFGGHLASYNESQLSRTTLSQQLRAQQIPSGFQTSAPPPPALTTGAAATQADLQIIPDESTNSLLIRASQSDWLRVRQTIDSLDIRPLQVLIEVMIAEVRRGNDHNLGVAVGVADKPWFDIRGSAGGTIGQETNGDVVLRLLDVGAIDARVVMSAMARRADVTILSRPVILAHNNAEARILIGSQRPFVQVVRALPTESAVRDQIIQYREVGTSLQLIPTINPDGYVTLDMVQEVSSATDETQFGAPVISTREASTQLLVRDGQTAVIGGLIDRQTEDVKTGVLFLKDLPFIGRLFGSTRRNHFRTELFLFLTPRVIRTDSDVDAIREGIETNAELLEKALRKAKPLVPADSSRNH